MKWIGQHIWDLTSRFRNDIYFEDLAETAETRGLVVDANGKVSINPLSGDEHATHIYENVRNDEGATIPVGTPVYSKGEIGGSERIKVGIADASDPAKMPAIGITNTELTTTGDTQDGLITLVGVYNTNLTGFTGVSENDIVYVAVGGGLTITKPTGANLIQNVGIVLKTNGTIMQGLAVTCIGRTNDVPTPLYIDHANQRLGIGTTAPDHKFHVEFTNGDTSFSGGSLGNWGSDGIRIENTSGTADTMAMLQFRNADADIHIAGIRQGTNDSDLGFFFEGSEKMRITSSGNVGIGTASPTVKLDVSGGAKASGTIAAFGNDTSGFSGHGMELRVINGVGSLLSYNRSTSTRMPAEIGGSYVMFDVGGAEKMRVDTSGNVGIGITSPSAKLHVNGDVLIESTNPALFFTDTNSDSDYSIKVNGGILSVRDETNDAARISLKSNGNVGIGTTSPNALLDVDNRIYLQNDGTVKWGASANAGHLTWGTNQAIVKGLSGQALLLGSNNTSARMTIDTSGNVGIGTNSPSAKLEVTDGHVLIRTNTAGSALTWRESDNGNIAGQLRSYANRGDIYLYKDGVVRTEISSLDDSFIPRLHIGGTNQASEALQVTGNAVITGDLTVQGTTVTLDTTNLNVEDKNITLNYSAGDSSGSADGAGITIQDAVDASNDATMLWNASSDRFDFSHPITAKDNIRFVTSGGTDGGLIDMDSNNDLVISNPLGDVLLGDGSTDVFIGDGTNNVDIRFEQSGSITADNANATLTIGGTGNLVVEEPTINNPTFSGAFNLGSKLTLSTSNGYILFDYEPAGDTGEYTTEVPLLKVDHNGTEKTILSRISENGGIQLGHDDSVLITAGDVGDEIKSNWSATNENVVLASEAGFYALAFPNNSTTWSNRNIFRFYGGDATAANNGLYIGDGSSTQFIDLDRNISAASVTAGNIKAMGGGNLFVYDDDDDTKIHFFASSNSNEGFLQLSNGSNWGLLARGKGNDPRLGAYHNGYLSIWGFGSNTGADHADDDELARFDFANERFIVNGEISAGGNITTSSNSYIVSSRKFTARDANGTGLFADDAASGLSIADDGDATFTGDLTVNGVNYGAYHSVSEDQYYFDDYNGRRNLALFYKNARADIIRYQPVDNFEYWNGSAWVADSSQESNVKKLLDGRQDTSWNVPSTYYKFRFTTQTTTSWPTMAMIWMQTSWSGSTWPGATMLVEEYDGSSWATKVTAEFTNTNGITNWGLSSRADTALHTGNGHNADTTRITVDFYGWTPSNGSYTTIPLQNLMITSNYAGTENTDYTNLLDYDRDVAIPNDMTVGGNTTMSGNLTINSTYPRIFLTDSNHNDDWSIINNDGKFGIYNDTDTSYALSINGSNNVGIGTTSPESKLHITDANPILIMEDTSNPNKNKIENVDGNMRYHADYNSNMGNSRHIFFIDNSEKVRFEANGNVGIGTTSPSELLTIAAESPTLRFEDISSSNYTEMYVNNFDTYLNTNGRFFIQNQGSTKVTFKSDGNVGIGTTSPSEKLEVSGKILATGGQIRAGSYLESYPSFSFADDIDTGMFSDTADQLEFVTGGSSRVTINSSGNVGIGTTSPNTKLQVAGDIRADYNIIFSGTGFINNNTNSLQLETVGNKDILLSPNGTGNVGIGTTSPSYALDVGGEIKSDGYRIDLSATTQRAISSTGTDSIQFGDAGVNEFKFKNAAGTSVLINSSGNVGIGTTSPSEKLEVDGNIKIGDNQRIAFGSGDDLRITHDSTNSYIQNFTGHLNITNQADDGDIKFSSDDGSGGVAEYFRLDGALGYTRFWKHARLEDNVELRVGTGNDLKIYHDGTNNYIQGVNGDLYIQNGSDDKDIILRSDDGSGGQTAYLTLDGSAGYTVADKDIYLVDDVRLRAGTGGDFSFFHDGSNSKINNNTGNIRIENFQDDGDIQFFTDDGSGGTAEYFRLDGGDAKIYAYKDIKFGDGVSASFGNNDYLINHNGTNSVLSNYTGNLQINNYSDDGDIILSSDDGSGGLTAYLTIDGSTERVNFNKPIKIVDSTAINVGSGLDLRLTHDGTDSLIQNFEGNLEIQQRADDKDIIFKSDDGSGGVTSYLTLDGGLGRIYVYKRMQLQDSVGLYLGTSTGDLIYHNGSNTFWTHQVGDLTIETNQDDGDIIFKSDDGSGGTTEYFRVDGGAESVIFSKYTRHTDGIKANFGNGDDLQISHDGSDSYINNFTGSLVIRNNTDDGDIIFQSDDGSGGVEEYFRLDGSANTAGNPVTLFPDNSLLGFGSGYGDLQLHHDGSHSYIKNRSTGNLYIRQEVDDSDIIFQSDDGSGGLATYLQLDGSSVRTRAFKDVNFDDSVKATFGASSDLQIYHDGSNSFIVDAGTGDLLNYFSNEWKVIKYGSSETCIEATSDGSVDLYYDNSKKFETTSTGVEVTGDLTVNGDSVQTKQMVVTTHNFQMANTTGTFFYVPFNNLNESSAATSAEYWTRSIAPYAGTIKKVIVRSHTSLGSSCQIRVSKITDTTDDLPSGTHVTNTGIDISTANTSVSTTMSTNTFAEGDVVGVALNRSAGSSARVVVTIVWEYTV